MSALSEPAAAAIVQSIWQETAIGLSLWAILRAMRHATANARYLVSCAGLAAMLLAPVATFVDAFSGPAHASPSSAVPLDPRGDVTLVMADGSRIWTNRIPPAGVLSALYGAIVPVWLAGALLASIRLLWAAGYVGTVRDGGTAGTGAMAASVNRLAASLGVRRRIAVIVTPRTASPATVGWIKPVILLPPVLITGLSSTQLEAIVAHELAHIRRHDYIVNLLQMVVETVLFYHPAVWWMSRQIRIERELCCDDVAVRVTGKPADYAHALAAVARHAVTAVAVGAGGPSLPHRVRRLLATSARTEQAGAGSVAVTLFVLAFVGAAGTWVHGQTSTPPRAERATLSLTVLDPLGQPAAGIPLVFEQGAFQAGSLFGHGFTDRAGHYTISLPPGTYLFSALIDFFPPTEVTLTPGTGLERTVRMALEPMTGAFTVCIDCRESVVPAPASVAEDLQRDREDYATALARTAEPADGWEQYRVAVPESLRQLGRSVAGSVTVAGRVGIDGRLKDLRAVSSAHPALSEAALEALGAQRWLPARVRSTAVEIDVRIDLEYVWKGDQ